MFRALAEEVSSAYVLAFYPPEEKRRDGQVHTIRVEGPRGLTLRQSRSEYRAADKQVGDFAIARLSDSYELRNARNRQFLQYSSSSSSSSKLSSSTMSNSTGSSPTTSSSVPHSSQDTISPLSVSKSTWTSASHSGQVPVGTVSSSPAIGEGRDTPRIGRAPLPGKQPNQSTRERWNLQQSFSMPRHYIWYADNYVFRFRTDCRAYLQIESGPTSVRPYETNLNAGLTGPHTVSNRLLTKRARIMRACSAHEKSTRALASPIYPTSFWCLAYFSISRLKWSIISRARRVLLQHEPNQSKRRLGPRRTSDDVGAQDLQRPRQFSPLVYLDRGNAILQTQRSVER